MTAIHHRPSAAVYARLVHPNSADAVDQQVQHLQKMAEEMGFDVVKVVKEIGTPKEGLHEIVEGVQNGEYTHVMIHNLSRLGRVGDEGFLAFAAIKAACGTVVTYDNRSVL